jgi:hypothetical protein
MTGAEFIVIETRRKDNNKGDSLCRKHSLLSKLS